MRILSLALSLILFASPFAANPSWAASSSLCGQRGSQHEANLQDAFSGQWTMTWTKGFTTVSGMVVPIETIPPPMKVTLSMKDGILSLRGDKFKRDFDVRWDADVIANFDAPDASSTYSGLLDTDETAVLFDCPIKDTPYLNGVSMSTTSATSVTKAKGPQTELHLWTFSTEQMLGLSVANVGPAVSRQMFVLTNLQ